jgi:Tfp pilus assembly protein PilP
VAPPASASTPQTAAQGTTAPPSAASPVEPQGYTYDPQGRRDPFVSLLRRGSEVPRTGGPGARPNGLAGLETGEVTLKGTLASQGTYVGILQGSDQKTYIVKAGDRLLDGTIRAITPDSMVITQQVTDPLSLEKQREVRKLLRQTEEAK